MRTGTRGGKPDGEKITAGSECKVGGERHAKNYFYLPLPAGCASGTAGELRPLRQHPRGRGESGGEQAEPPLHSTAERPDPSDRPWLSIRKGDAGVHGLFAAPHHGERIGIYLLRPGAERGPHRQPGELCGLHRKPPQGGTPGGARPVYGRRESSGVKTGAGGSGRTQRPGLDPRHLPAAGGCRKAGL